MRFHIGWSALGVVVAVLLLVGVPVWRAVPTGHGEAGGATLATNPARNSHERGPEVGDVAPDIRAPDERGRHWELRQLRGRNVLLSFFCGCEPCRLLARAQARLSRKRRNAQILVVSYIDPESVPDFRRATGLSAPFLLDPFGDIGSRYGSLSCPHSWLVDEQGIIRYHGSPVDQPQDVVRQVENLLSPSTENDR